MRCREGSHQEGTGPQSSDRQVSRPQLRSPGRKSVQPSLPAGTVQGAGSPMVREPQSGLLAASLPLCSLNLKVIYFSCFDGNSACPLLSSFRGGGGLSGTNVSEQLPASCRSHRSTCRGLSGPWAGGSQGHALTTFRADRGGDPWRWAPAGWLH